ncbi:PilN domain-containing protein [Planctomycetota bacterium]|nr:PilN domain-containing protein [Planctomycetota bacterium]
MKKQKNNLIQIRFSSQSVNLFNPSTGFTSSYTLEDNAVWNELAIKKALTDLLEKSQAKNCSAICFIPCSWCFYETQNIPIRDKYQLNNAIKLQSQKFLQHMQIDMTKDCFICPKDNGHVVLLSAIQQSRAQAVHDVLKIQNIVIQAITPTLLYALNSIQSRDFPSDALLLLDDHETEILRNPLSSRQTIQHVVLDDLIESNDDIFSILGIEKQNLGEANYIIDWINLDQKGSPHIESIISRLEASEHITLREITSTHGLLDSKLNHEQFSICNFISPNLDNLQTAKPGNKKRSLLIVSTILILLASLCIWHILQKHQDIQEIEYKLNALQTKKQNAEAVIDKVEQAEQWYSKKAETLDCLLVLTNISKAQPNIWLYNLEKDITNSFAITGEARSEEEVLQLVEGMNRNSNIDNVRIVNINLSNDSRQVKANFNIRFKYQEKN